MSLIHLKDVRAGFGGPPLLDGVDLRIEAGERICLVGRNGSGKSTLLKLISGHLQPEEGRIERRQGLRVALLEQEVPEAGDDTVYDVAARGLGEDGELLARYHRLSLALGGTPDPARLAELERVQHALEAGPGWSARQRVERVLSRLQLPADRPFGELSGGFRRRVLLARALVGEPDLLLLDEPTNHLDTESIEWLETFLLDFRGTLLFVTHDRRFLQRLATRLVDLDRGRLSDWPGDYRTYLERKQAWLEAEARRQAEFDKKLAREEAWIRQGIKARRTRNEGRVRALQALREQRRARREPGGEAQFHALGVERSGKLVIEAEHLDFAFGDRVLVRDFSTTVLRGDKIGLIGPNGAGKSTLIKLLLGRLQPDGGELRLGTRLDVAWFDQLRSRLDPERSVIDNLADGRQKITVDGRERHVVSYLQDFLFAPDRLHTPVRALSGGERNRLLLARLFSQPANLLVLDEPTNDLDVETLELLESLLVGYTGTLLLVSHDRAFLDNAVTSTLVFEGDGRIGEYVGGYSDWQRQHPAADARPPAAPKKPARPAAATRRQHRLGYREQRELAELPGRIEALEQRQAELHAAMAAPDFYKRPGRDIAAAKAELARIDTTLEQAYQRWQALEERVDGVSGGGCRKT